MAVTVIIRAKLKGDRASMQALHDSVTGATKEMALQAGDVTLWRAEPDVRMVRPPLPGASIASADFLPDGP